jgi:hypothetical protein
MLDTNCVSPECRSVLEDAHQTRRGERHVPHGKGLTPTHACRHQRVLASIVIARRLATAVHSFTEAASPPNIFREAVQRKRGVHMSANEAAIRKACRVAETRTLPGSSTASRQAARLQMNQSRHVRGQDIGRTVEIYATAFHMHQGPVLRGRGHGHRRTRPSGNPQGPLALPSGTIPPTGKRMDAPVATSSPERQIQSFADLSLARLCSHGGNARRP